MEICILLGYFSSVTVKTCNVTMQRTNTNLMSSKTLDWNSYFKVDFQSIQFYIDYIDGLSVWPNMIASLLSQFKSYLQCVSCMNILCSLRKEGGLKRDFEILCFRRRPQHVSLRPLHCDVECSDCGRWKLVS